MIQARTRIPAACSGLGAFLQEQSASREGKSVGLGHESSGHSSAAGDKSPPVTDLTLPSEHMDGIFQSQRCEHPHVKLRFCVMKAF